MIILWRTVRDSNVQCVEKEVHQNKLFWIMLRASIFPIHSHTPVNSVGKITMPRTRYKFTFQPNTKAINDFFYILVNPSTLNDYIKKDISTGAFSCTLCGKVNAQKNNIRKHIEGVHFPGQFVYDCSICYKRFNGKNSLSVHMYKFHSNAQ